MNIVENAAKAIYEKRNGAGCKPWARQSEAHKSPYRDDAVAALRSLAGNATAEMITAMDEMHMPFGDMSAAWDGAIATALVGSGKPQPSEGQNESTE